jgi:hypothetical protein
MLSFPFTPIAPETARSLNESTATPPFLPLIGLLTGFLSDWGLPER